MWFAFLYLALSTGINPCSTLGIPCKVETYGSCDPATAWDIRSTGTDLSLISAQVKLRINGDCRVFLYSDAQCSLNEIIITTANATNKTFKTRGCSPCAGNLSPFGCGGSPPILLQGVWCLDTALCQSGFQCIRAIQLTTMPTISPSGAPSSIPTTTPSKAPSSIPSFIPSVEPSNHPTNVPTTLPSFSPSSEPSASPTVPPTVMPSPSPSTSPTSIPTTAPTQGPTSICRTDTIEIVTSTFVSLNGQCFKEQSSTTTRPKFQCINAMQTIEWSVLNSSWEIASTQTNEVFRYWIDASSDRSFWPPEGQRWWETPSGNHTQISIVCAPRREARRVVATPQKEFQDFVSTAGFWIIIVGAVIVVVTAVFAKIAENRLHGGDKLGGGIFALPLYFLQMLDLLTDILFAIALFQGGYIRLFFISVSFIIVPWCLGAMLLLKMITQDWSRSEILSAWLKSGDKFLIALYVFSGSFTRTVRLVNSKLFYHKLFDMGLRNRQLDSLAKFRLLPLLLENLPQIIVQVYYYALNEADVIVVAAFVVTMMSFLTSLLFGLARFRDRHTPYSPEDVYVHFFIQIQCSRPRDWYRCSRKNVASAIAHYVFKGKHPDRVEVYDARVDRKSKRMYFAGVVAWKGTEADFNSLFLDGDHSKLLSNIRNYLQIGNGVHTTVTDLLTERRDLPAAKSIHSHLETRTRSPRSETAVEVELANALQQAVQR